MRIDRYDIVRELGKGGMGVVYEAIDSDGSHCALKVFTLDHGNVDLLARRFLVEAKIRQELGRVRDYGIDVESGRPWFTMELVLNEKGEPETLEDVRRRGNATDETMRRWFAELEMALVDLHARGIVHRDVKLENVLLDAKGHAVLTDFGVSRVLAPDLREKMNVSTTFVSGETAGTRSVMGSYWYLAPEVRAGGEATEASDWYALGVLFFRFLTGLWYEPDSRAFDLLAPFPSFWRETLPRLLGPAPDRICVRPKRRWARWCGGALLVVAGLAGCGLWWWREGGESPREITMRDCGGYALSETPVTCAQWAEVMGVKKPAKEMQNWPVTNVTWDEATNFCARLSVQRGMPSNRFYRLPTAKEWCDAYRKGRTAPHIPLGQDMDSELRTSVNAVGWFGQGVDGIVAHADIYRWHARRKRRILHLKDFDPSFPPYQLNGMQDAWMRDSAHVPMPVALKPGNALGLFDMAGNVFEMVAERADTDAAHSWCDNEYGFRFEGMPPTGNGSLLLFGQPLTPGLAGDEPWGSYFPKMPHVGFRIAVDFPAERRPADTRIATAEANADAPNQ